MSHGSIFRMTLQTHLGINNDLVFKYRFIVLLQESKVPFVIFFIQR